MIQGWLHPHPPRLAKSPKWNQTPLCISRVSPDQHHRSRMGFTSSLPGFFLLCLRLLTSLCLSFVCLFPSTPSRAPSLLLGSCLLAQITHPSYLLHHHMLRTNRANAPKIQAADPRHTTLFYCSQWILLGYKENFRVRCCNHLFWSTNDPPTTNG
jgi:hypothetical protein